MSGFPGNGEQAVINECQENLHHLNEEGLAVVYETWRTIYGKNNAKLSELTLKVENELKAFWEYQTEAQEERKRSLLTSIEQTGEEAFQLETALGLPHKVGDLHNDIPLVDLEEQLLTILDSYQKLKEQRIEDYSAIQNKEKALCALLDETPQFLNLSDPQANTQSEARSVRRDVPSTEDMEQFEQRIKELEGLKHQLKYDFESCKEELRSLLKECEIIPFKKVERFACSANNEQIDFPVKKQNLAILREYIQSTRAKKEGMILEADQLKEEISTLSKKILKDPDELKDFLNHHHGFTVPVVEKLKEKLKTLKEERKQKLKHLILENRNMLDEWWTKCCYSDDQRAKFSPYNVDYYVEEVLDLHELELEQVQRFYTEHKRIFQLAQKHQEMWDRLLHLEEAATQVDRLFSNRGGKLLQEEKERKVIQKSNLLSFVPSVSDKSPGLSKAVLRSQVMGCHYADHQLYVKLPAIGAELMTLLNAYKAEKGTDFLYFGAPLLDTLQQKEEEREVSKENKKLTRKAANTENILLESRLGVRPAVAVNSVGGAKRKNPTLRLPVPANKTMKMAPLSRTNSTASTASYKSAVSSASGQKVMREEIPARRRRLLSPGRGLRPSTSYETLHTPVRTFATSTPKNGSPSYESFQDYIENSIRKEICRSSTKMTSSEFCEQEILLVPLLPKPLQGLPLIKLRKHLQKVHQKSHSGLPQAQKYLVLSLP